MKTFRMRTIFSDARRMLLAVESVTIRHSKSNTFFQMQGSLEPVAVIICGPEAIYALDMKAMPITYDRLREEIPELNAILAPFLKARPPTSKMELM